MTKKKYRRYSAEFKQHALRRASEDGVTDKEVCEDLGVSQRQLRRWRDQFRLVGDVAKGWLDIYAADECHLERIENTDEAIGVWLRGLSGPVQIAVEATNHYHELFIERAHEQGHRVYVIDAFKLSRYRDAVGHRAKTDYHDAELLARYLQQEQAHLERWQPRDPPDKALAPVEASCNAGTDKRSVASEPGRYRHTGCCRQGAHRSLSTADTAG